MNKNKLQPLQEWTAYFRFTEVEIKVKARTAREAIKKAKDKLNLKKPTAIINKKDSSIDNITL